MTLLVGALVAREEGRRSAASDPWSCPQCLAQGDVCVAHEAMGVGLDVELFELLDADSPARLDDPADYEPVGESW